MTELTAVLVVDKHGKNGRCSNCNEPASLSTEKHGCKAKLDRVAMLASETPTKVDLILAPAMAREHGKQYVGRGKIVKVSSGWEFRPARGRGG